MSFNINQGLAEYADIVNIIKNQKDFVKPNSSVYEELIKKEDRVLDTVDRVIDDFQRKKEENKYFTSMPVSKAINTMFINLIEILEDLIDAENLTTEKFMNIVTKNQRSIYLGLFMLIIAFFIILVNIGEGESKNQMKVLGTIPVNFN